MEITDDQLTTYQEGHPRKKSMNYKIKSTDFAEGANDIVTVGIGDDICDPFEYLYH